MPMFAKCIGSPTRLSLENLPPPTFFPGNQRPGRYELIALDDYGRSGSCSVIVR